MRRVDDRQGFFRQNVRDRRRDGRDGRGGRVGRERRPWSGEGGGGRGRGAVGEETGSRVGRRAGTLNRGGARSDHGFVKVGGVGRGQRQCMRMGGWENGDVAGWR